MSHVDEGRLNEYLDRLERPADNQFEASVDRAAIESHLAECAECRALLAETRHLRERAASLLDVAAPAATAVPPFATVLARAGRTERRRRIARMNRLTALGWAATVVLAVGVGWIARGAVGLNGAIPSRQPTEQVADETVRSVADEAPDASVAAEVGGALQRADIASEPEESRRHASEMRRQAPPAAAPLAEAPLREREMAQAPAEEVLAADAATKGIVAAERRAKVEGVPLEPTSQEPAARDAVAAGALSLDAVRTQEVAVTATDVDIAIPSTDWVPSDLATATTHLSAPLRNVPDLPIESVETGSLFGRPAVRLRQRSGQTTVEVIQAASALLGNLAVESGAAADLRRGRRTSTDEFATAVVRNGTVVILRAALPPDSLRLLASRIP